jgi:hypothetical protein
MHRLSIGLILVAPALLSACDPIVRSRLRLAPPVTLDSVTAECKSEPSEPIAAVEQLALRFGLKAETQRSNDGTRTWRGRTYPSRAQSLYIYTHTAPDGTLDVAVSEIITKEWTPRGDSLRNALVTTLACFGMLHPESPAPAT